MNWRELLEKAASDPGLTLDKAKVETLRAFLGYVVEGGEFTPGHVASVLEGAGRADKGDQGGGQDFSSIVAAINGEDADN